MTDSDFITFEEIAGGIAVGTFAQQQPREDSNPAVLWLRSQWAIRITSLGTSGA
jgi:hypothetical protein